MSLSLYSVNVATNGKKGIGVHYSRTPMLAVDSQAATRRERSLTPTTRDDDDDDGETREQRSPTSSTTCV